MSAATFDIPGGSAAAPAAEVRQDLRLARVDPDRDGAPGWVLHDPVTQRFFRLSWVEVEIIAALTLGGPDRIARHVAELTGQPVGEAEVRGFVGFLERNDLLLFGGDHGRKRLVDRAALARRQRWRALGSSYLSLRIPLLRPDTLLARTRHLVGWCFHPAMGWALAAVFLAGAFLALRQGDVFVATAERFLNADGLLIYALALSVVKIAHEFGHAYTANRFACRVPTMGVAFLVFWPVLYTDASEAWLVPSRRRRLAIGAAGMLVEGAIGAVALLVWSFLTPGAPKDLAFVLATSSLFMTLIVNLNPLMRFDGYYLLNDFLRTHNLQSRALAQIGWQLRRFLFGFADPPPETPRPMLTVYGWAVIAYRGFLTLAIAALVYVMAFKALAIVMGAAVLAGFFVTPVVKFFRAAFRRWNDVNQRRFFVRAGLILGGSALLLLYPFPARVTAVAHWQGVRYAQVFAPANGNLAEFNATAGRTVREGETLALFTTPDLDFSRDQTQREIETLRLQISLQGVERRYLERSGVIETELRTDLERLRGIEALRARNVVTAPFAGRIVDVAPGLRPGLWIGEGEPLFAIVDDSKTEIVAYVSERDLGLLQPGARARFVPDAGGEGTVALTVRDIDPAGLRELDMPFHAAEFGGAIPVRRADGGLLIPAEALYRVRLDLDDAGAKPARVLTGTALIEGKPASALGRIYRSVLGVLRREAGF